MRKERRINRPNGLTKEQIYGKRDHFYLNVSNKPTCRFLFDLYVTREHYKFMAPDRMAVILNSIKAKVTDEKEAQIVRVLNEIKQAV